MIPGSAVRPGAISVPPALWLTRSTGQRLFPGNRRPSFRRARAHDRRAVARASRVPYPCAPFVVSVLAGPSLRRTARECECACACERLCRRRRRGWLGAMPVSRACKSSYVSIQGTIRNRMANGRVSA
ncbi:hypothetical protein BU26DRAFT_353211 [Trematosphaeria pertusa]|uniref:Uncharacterized protein n=1 Tax=Trematosphaeria pertusa TaxID=390896 RepID=A0A6A6IB13_9PLEO|nr:uncharacterized protein BU26DRAFT_353211 [Trematosphaeria pertusa]KAF2247764.1 hypothetical protein BU26DRAFT_353211 [Trematosphaeria pertusa]